MISSPLISALEKDEEFLAGVLQSTENDPYLRLDQLEVIPNDLSSDGYINSITKIRVQGRTGRHSKPFFKTLVIKRPPEQLTRLQSHTFYNEVSVFSSVLPALQRWVGNKYVLPFPPCLHASASVIVLEDNGLSMGDRLKGLDLDHSIAAFQALGRFHAVSLSLKRQDKCAFDHILTKVQEVVFVPESAPVFGASLESALQLAVSCLKQCSEQVIFDAVQMLQSLRGRTFRTLMSLVAPKEPLSVICHGDFWINNVIFGYKNEKITELALTDLQVVRYSSPATDILHFMYTSLEPGLSRFYSDHLLKIYHKSLSETMAEISPSVPPITLEEILDEIESHALYGLLISFLVLPSIAESAKNVEVSSECCNSFSFTYSQRVKDIIFEFIEKSYI